MRTRVLTGVRHRPHAGGLGSRRGFSLIELLVASTLLISVLAGSSLVIANVERQLLESRLGDTATSLGVSLTEKASAFGCGSAVDPASSSTRDLAARCSSLYGGQASPGDARFQASDADGTQYQVTVSSRWRQIGAGDACYSASAGTVGSAQLLRPALLERTATLEWTLAGQTRTRSTSLLQATPTSSAYNGPGTGGLVVRTTAGTLVTVNSATGTPVSRFATPCAGGAAAYFPFLPPGEYRLGRDGVAATPVTVQSGLVQEVSLS